MNERNEQSMHLPMHRWKQVKQHFSEHERAELCKAVTGEMTEAPGLIVNPSTLNQNLAAKIRLHFPQVREKASAAC